MSIYVEITINGEMDDVWLKTQSPELHERWDLRFTDIEYLPRTGETQPQRFLYRTRIGFGLAACGEGESVATRSSPDGIRTSALKFWSNDSKSLIKEGAGYWQYVPSANGIQFLTSYDYHVRFGRLGRMLDLIAFRPLLGWATAWSFDRLRLWIERGIDPASSMRFAILHQVATATIAFVWIYQGAVPKLMFRQSEEIAMLQDAGISASAANSALSLIGFAEIVLGVLVILFSKFRWPFVLTFVLMIIATASVAVHSPARLIAAFNPVSLNVLMAAMAVVGWVCIGQFPMASRCLRKMPEKRQ
jgi:hypothetical protein